MITPRELENYTNKAILGIIDEIDNELIKTHGYYPWDEAVIGYDLTLNERNKIAEMYLDAGWKFVYHRTSEENGEKPGLTTFILSMSEVEHAEGENRHYHKCNNNV